MENATKALLIAAAVLIVIIIITLGVYVINIGKEQMDNGNQTMSEMEISTFNSKFDTYAGENVVGSKVKALVKVVYNHNLNESDDSKKVALTGDVVMATDATSQPSVAGGDRYDVVCVYGSAGYITSITITKK